MYEDTMDAVRAINEKVAAKVIQISWPSKQALASSAQRKSKRRGPGFVFAGHKLYDPADGDDPRHIDHNASASAPEEDEMYVKTFFRPRVLYVSTILDVNRSMNLGTVGTLKSFLGALCAGCVIQSARKTNDQAAFFSYAFAPITIMKVQSPHRMLTRALVQAVEDRESPAVDKPQPALREQAASLYKRWLGKQEEEAKGEGEGGGLEMALTAARQSERSLYVVISDFVNANDEDWEALRLCGMKHDLIAVFVQDKRERELPTDVPWPGMQFPLEDFGGRAVKLFVAPNNISGWLRKMLSRIVGVVTTPDEYRAKFETWEREVNARLEDCRARVVTVSTDRQDEAVFELLSVLANKMR